MGRARPFLIVPALALAGCLAGPPPAPEPAFRLQADPLPTPREAPPPPPPEGPSLGVTDTVAAALAGNPRLRVLAEQVAAARAGRDVALAPFLPQVDFQARYSAFNVRALPTGNFAAGTLTGGTFAFAMEELGLQYTLVDFGRRSGRLGEAGARADAALLHLDRGRQAIAFEAAAGYFLLLAARADVAVWRSAVRRAEDVLRDARARKEGGNAQRADVLRAEVALAEARTGLTTADEAAFAAAARLNTTMGRPAPTPLEPADNPSPDERFDVPLDECLARATAGRPEIRAAERLIAGAAAGEQAARAEFCPRIYAKAGLFRVDGVDRLHGWVDGAGVHLEQTLYAGGRHSAEVRGAEARVREATAQARVVLDQVALEVSLAWSAIGSARERLRLGEAAAESAAEHARLTEVRYRNGDATPTDVADAQTALTRALTARNTARYDYCIALAQLDYATGGTPAPSPGVPP
jgi:outer membrane protein